MKVAVWVNEFLVYIDQIIIYPIILEYIFPSFSCMSDMESFLCIWWYNKIMYALAIYCVFEEKMMQYGTPIF